MTVTSVLLGAAVSDLRVTWRHRWKKLHDGSDFSVRMRALEVQKIRLLCRAVRLLKGLDKRNSPR